jgi:hypothetical protein
VTAPTGPPAAGPPALPAVLRVAARLIERRDLRRAVWLAADRDPATYRRLMRAHLASGKPTPPACPDRDTTLTKVNAR